MIPTATDAPRRTLVQAQMPYVRRSYMWGPDMSGTLDGAGGVGGLLAMRRHERGTQSTETFWATHDLNGNVIGLVQLPVIGSQPAKMAVYDYDPSGQLTRVNEPEANFNPIRFSSKYTDSETGLVYYGHRYLSPELGRWISRDPIGEEGGINLYGMVGNDLVNRWDLLGCSESQPDPPLTPANTVSIKVNGNLPEPRASSGTKGRANLALIHFMLGFDNKKKIVYVSKSKAEGSAWWYKAVTPELNKIRGWHEHRHEQDNFQLWELLFEYAEKFKQRCATVEEFKCNEKAFRILVSAFGLSETYLLNLRHSDQNDPWMIKEAIGNERANAAAAAQDAKSRLEAQLKSFYGELRRCQQKHRGMPYMIEVMRDNDNWVQRHIESIQAIFNTKTQDTQFAFPGASPP